MALTSIDSAGPSNPRAKTGSAQKLTPDGIPTDQWGRPRIRPQAGAPMPGTRGGWQRASTLGGMLEDQYGIGEWRQRQVLLGVAARPSIGLRVKDIDDPRGSGKSTLSELVAEAHEAADSDEAARVGTAMHALAERVDRGQDLGDLGAHGPALKAYAELMKAFEVLHTERRVVWDAHQLTGRFDRIVRTRVDLTYVRDGRERTIPAGTVVVLDIKTSQTADYFGVKFVVQLDIYANGDLYDHDGDEDAGILPGTRTPHGASREVALILHMPSGGATAKLHVVQLGFKPEAAAPAGSTLVEHALMVRQDRKLRGLVVPVVEIGELAEPASEEVSVLKAVAAADTQAGKVAARLAEAHRAAAAAQTKAQARTDAGVWAELRAAQTKAQAREVWMRNQGDWQPEHTAYASALAD